MIIPLALNEVNNNNNNNKSLINMKLSTMCTLVCKRKRENIAKNILHFSVMKNFHVQREKEFWTVILLLE